MGLNHIEKLYFGVAGSLFCGYDLLDLLFLGSTCLIAFRNCGSHGVVVLFFRFWNSGVVSLLQVHLGRNLTLDYHRYLFFASMDYKELQEIQRVLQMNEESIYYNRNSLFSVTLKVYENEHHITSKLSSIMSTLV